MAYAYLILRAICFYGLRWQPRKLCGVLKGETMCSSVAASSGDFEVMGQEFSHEGVNSEHTSYDQYEQEEEKHEEVDVDYMDEDDTNVEPMFDYHDFDEGQEGLVNDADSVRDDVQVDASRAGLATNDLGNSMPRDPRKCRTKGGLRSPIKENIDVDSVAWRATIEQLVVFVVAFHS
ncbi:hypothetical protein HN873_067717 [Arachis hypogaea]